MDKSTKELGKIIQETNPENNTPQLAAENTQSQPAIEII